MARQNAKPLAAEVRSNQSATAPEYRFPQQSSLKAKTTPADKTYTTFGDIRTHPSNAKSLCLQWVKNIHIVSNKIQDIVVYLLLLPQDVGVNWVLPSFGGEAKDAFGRRWWQGLLKEYFDGHSLRYTNP